MVMMVQLSCSVTKVVAPAHYLLSSVDVLTDNYSYWGTLWTYGQITIATGELCVP